MPKPDPLVELRARFIGRSRERVASLRALLDAAAAECIDASARADESEPDVVPAEAIVRLAHQLAGAAGTFGYTAMSEAAAALEDRVRATGQAARALDAGSLEPLVAALESCIAELASASC